MITLLLDQGLPRSTVDHLRVKDIQSFLAFDLGLSRAADSEIIEYARQRALTVVTLDSDIIFSR